MPTLTGIGATLSVDDANGDLQNITADVTSLTINTSRGSQDVTSLDVSAMKRLLLLSDATIDITGVVNDSTNASFDVFATHSSFDSARTVTFVRNGHTLSMEMILTSFNIPRPQDASMTFSANLQLASGTDPAWA